MPMKDSRMTDDWLRAVVASNPIRIAPKTGNIITCPVRLAFVNLLTPAKPMDGNDTDKKPTYNCVALFPPGCQELFNTIMGGAVMAAMAQHFPGNRNPDGTYSGLHSPFRDQAHNQKYAGYTPGLVCITAGTTTKPQITDPAGNPIVDPARVYSGVWAILAVNTYAYGIKPVRPKKGINFGLQNVMIFADDENIGGGAAPPPQDDFAGVNIDHAYNPAAQFGNAPPGAPPPGAMPPGILPPSTPVYAPPAGGALPPGFAPAAPSNFGMPPGYGTPPAAQPWQPPAAPAAKPFNMDDFT